MRHVVLPFVPMPLDDSVQVDESHMFHLSSAGAPDVDEREAAAARYMPSRADILAARLVG